MRLISYLFGALALLCVLGGTANAQGCGQANPNCIVPTAPMGTNNNQAASTAFVQQNGTNLSAVYTGISGDCTATSFGVMTCTKTNGELFYTDVPMPVNPMDAATKQYVDNIATGVFVHVQGRLATTTALPTNTYNNGTSGVGATLTANSNGALSVDSVAVNVNDRVLVKNESAAANNGIYVVTAAGDGSDPYVLTRATDANTPGTSPTTIGAGSFIFITAGTSQANTGWTVNSTVATIGTSAINWAQFSSSTAGVSSLNGLTGTPSIAGTNGLSASAGGSTITITCANSTTSQIGCYELGTTLQASPNDPGGTSNTNPLMMGFGSTCSITPRFTGRIQINIQGTMSNTVTFGAITVRARYGTGSAPAHLASLAGTQTGSIQSGNVAQAGGVLPFNVGGIATGLSPSTTYWIDAAIDASNNGTASISNVSCSAMEF